MGYHWLVGSCHGKDMRETTQPGWNVDDRYHDQAQHHDIFDKCNQSGRAQPAGIGVGCQDEERDQ